MSRYGFGATTVPFAADDSLFPKVQFLSRVDVSEALTAGAVIVFVKEAVECVDVLVLIMVMMRMQFVVFVKLVIIFERLEVQFMVFEKLVVIKIVVSVQIVIFE